MQSGIEADANRYVLHAVRPARSVVFARAENARLWDIQGNEYLDTMSGSAGPAMVGHANPRVAEAVTQAMRTLPSVNLRHDNVPMIEYARQLAQIAPSGLSKTFLCSGGGEAIEAAIKLAMRITGRTRVLSLSGAYHGMSLTALSLGGMPALKEWLPSGALNPRFRQVPADDAYRPPGPSAALAALEQQLRAEDGQVPAALLIELVQGPNGHAVFSSDYYGAVQSLCRRYGVLLIVDEIQTGLARCGQMWACQHYEVKPDILVAGKAMGGGVPIGLFMTRPALIPGGMESEPWHMLTFMNQPLAASAGLAVLRIVEEEKLVERARHLGALVTARFKEMAQRYSVIGDVRGPGLFIGVEYVEQRDRKIPAPSACAAASARALELGLIVQFGGIANNVLKFKPPLTSSPADIDLMLERCEQLTAFIQQTVDASVTG